MVTSEGNRVQSPAMAPFERQAAAFQPVAETAESTARQSQSEPRGQVSSAIRCGSRVSWCQGRRSARCGGCSASILAILGLSGVAAVHILPVAGIVLGSAFLMLGAVDVAWARMFGFPEHGTSRKRIVLFGGAAAVSIAGLAAVVLSILNFAMLGDPRFAAIAVILLGAGLLWHSGPMRCVSHFTQDITYHARDRRPPSGPFAVNALSLAPTRDFVVGLGAAILGILAMMNIAPVILEFVALLALGLSACFTISTICSAALATLENACAGTSQRGPAS